MISHSLLTEQGWQKKGVYAEPRLSEVVKMYADLGFEIRIMPFEPDGEAACTECMRESPDRYRTVYTRKIRLIL